MKEKIKKPIFKKWWFWILIVIIAFAIIGGGGDDSDQTAKEQQPSNQEVSEPEESVKTEEEFFEEWFNNQFSAWDGSNRDLVNQVKSAMNDEDSFKHIETTFLKLISEDSINKFNKEFKDLLVENTKKYDTFLCMEFSGKNAFGGTVKQKAYAIMQYNPERNGKIILLGIE